MSWSAFIRQQLLVRQQNDNWRQRMCIEKQSGRIVFANNQRYLNFSSNDYLGLSQHPDIVTAWQRGAEQYGVGSGGSGHIIGYAKPHEELEHALASWLCYSRALLFISGFAANQAVISALIQPSDRIFADKRIHASIMESAMQSPGQLRRFTHNRVDSLSRLMQLPTKGKTLVVTEGIFSMDGDRAPLSTLHDITKEHNAWLMVDDAHGIGICGREGRGSTDEQGIKPDLLIVTFGKAMGISGAAVLCDNETADFFIQYARHLIYSTSMPPAQAVALKEALQQLRQAQTQRQQLTDNIRYFRQLCSALPYSLCESDTPIQPLIIGDNQNSMALAQFLRAHHIWVQAIRPPTVPPGTARLRITLSAMHTFSDIEQLVDALACFSAFNR